MQMPHHQQASLPPNTTRVIYTNHPQSAHLQQPRRTQSPSYTIVNVTINQNQQRSTQSPQAHSVTSSCASSPLAQPSLSNSQEGPPQSQQDIAKINERMVLKCARFFMSLLKYKATASLEQQSVLQLLREGVLSEISAEEFSAKLRNVTGSQDKGTLLPFLKTALPLLRISIRNGEQPELLQVLQLDANRMCLSPASSLPTPPQSQNSLMNGSQSAPPPFHSPQQQTPQIGTLVRPFSVQNSETYSSSPPVSTNFHQNVNVQKPDQMTFKQEIQAQQESSYNKQQQSYQESLPVVTGAPMQGPKNPSTFHREEPIIENDTIESANEGSRAQLVPENLQNLTQLFVNPQALADRILAHMPDAQGVESEVLSIISMATEVRLRTVIAHLATLAEHRQEPLRIKPMYTLVDEPRKQMRFMEDIDRRTHESRECAEKEALLRITKGKGKDRDTMEKAKQLQKADREAMVNREANLAAFAALGGSKVGLKRQFGTANNPSDGGANWKSGMQGQGLGEGLTGAVKGRSSIARIKRITMRDLQFYLCNDPLIPNNSRLRHRIALSTLSMDENNPNGGGGTGA